MIESNFNATARQLIFALPVFMGAIEYIIRTAFDKTDEAEFFSISLVVAGIGLFIALTALPQRLISTPQYNDPLERSLRLRQKKRFNQEQTAAKFGIWLSIVGLTGWVYLLVASFSEQVRAAIPYHPLLGAALYYAAGATLNEWKARRPNVLHR